MLRRRPTAPSAAGWLCLGALYLTATVVNTLLAFQMAALWPALLAMAMAAVTVLCAIAAWRRF